MSVLKRARLHRANLAEFNNRNRTAADKAANAAELQKAVGSTSDHVRAAQRFARDIGVMLPVTGVLDAFTIRFVQTFQSAYMFGTYASEPLAADGIPGPLTNAAMEHSRAAKFRVSSDFYWREFVSKNPARIPTSRNPVLKIERALIEGMQHLRDFYQSPIIIVSGFRDTYWNAVVGGSKASQHLLGKAADFHVIAGGRKATSGSKMPTVEVCSRWFNGIGRHRLSGRVSHVDVRDWVARWFYSGA